MTPELLYRILLKAYPVGFRREYGEAMALCFRDQLRAADTAGKRVRLWFRTVADFALSIPARHLEFVLPRHGNSRFTDGALQTLFFARLEAGSFRRRQIGLEHLLLGALHKDRELATALLGPNGMEAVVRAIEVHEANPRRLPAQEELLLSQECKTAIARAWQEARGSGAKVSSRHLLAAILHQDKSMAARLLREHGRDLSRL
jgi:hypothetical protein